MQHPYHLDFSINWTYQPKLFQFSDPSQSGSHLFFKGKHSHRLPQQQTVMEYPPERASTAELYAALSFLLFLEVDECNT